MSLSSLPSAGFTASVLCGLAAIWAASRMLEFWRRHSRYTQLAGPPSTSLLFGVTKTVADMQETGEFCEDAGKLFEDWAEQYGPVYRIPAAFGSEKVVLCDPKAIQHFYSRETTGYVHTKMMSRAIATLVGCSMPPYAFVLTGTHSDRPRRALG